MTRLPLLAGCLDAPIARHAGRTITRGEFLAHVKALAGALPPGRHGVNACADRYQFLVAFAALLAAGRINLLPHNAAPRAIDDLQARYGAFRLDDALLARACEPRAPAGTIPEIPAEREAAVLFTSGSTGVPAAQRKTWGELTGSSRAAIERFALHAPHAIVATVPAQHSYGFESSTLYALLGPAVIHAGRPLFPADVRAALESMAAPRILVTTPLHLEACLEADIDWPSLAFCLSATAPLARELAARAEARFAAPLLEIYGSSETGAIASRRTTTETAWTPYAGVRVRKHNRGLEVSGTFLPQPRTLADRAAIHADGRFEWLGRESDQIKIAGKRTTLGELNARLLAIAGVEEGGFVIPANGARRLAAVVVAPRLTVEAIRAQLAEAIDPVFLPRPLRRVASLERTATGKLSRAELLAHLEAHPRKAATS